MTDSPRDRVASADLDNTGASSDYEMLARIRSGDENALGEMYDRYGGLVYTLALRIVGDRELAQEVLQDTFLRCWDGAAQFDFTRGRVAGWLMGVARNRAIDVLRSRQHQARLREHSIDMPSPGHAEPSEPDTSDQVVLRQTVSTALASLSTAQRQALEMAYYGGMSQAEVARTLGEPLGTVKTRMRDGLQRLRGLLWPVIETGEGGRAP